LANLIYVDDVVEAIVCAIERNEANGEIFIINNDKRKVPWAEYVGAHAEALGILPVISPQYNPDVQRVKETFSMLHDSVTIMFDVMRTPQLLALLAQVPAIVKIGSMIIKGRRRENIEASLASELTIPRPNPKILLKYEGTSKQFYKLLTCQTIFSASKSRKLLGFEPSVSIEEGMAKSIEWAKWAGYCDTLRQ
jgi:nucleoside-diphosphate-sugar epimerase